MKRELTHGSLFSGVEGFGLGTALAGIKTEWSCEFEKYQTEVIKKNFGDRNRCVGNAVQPLMAQYLFECIKCFGQ